MHQRDSARQLSSPRLVCRIRKAGVQPEVPRIVLQSRVPAIQEAVF